MLVGLSLTFLFSSLPYLFTLQRISVQSCNVHISITICIHSVKSYTEEIIVKYRLEEKIVLSLLHAVNIMDDWQDFHCSFTFNIHMFGNVYVYVLLKDFSLAK